MSKRVKVTGLVIIILVCLSISAMLFISIPACPNCKSKFCFGRCTIDYKLNGVEMTRKDAPKTNQNTTRLAKTENAGDSYFDNVTFIGDSRTVAWELYGIDPERIFAETSLTHEQAMTKDVVNLSDDKVATIAEAVMVTVPDTVIINFGINGAGWLDTKTFMEGYEKLIDSLIQASPASIFVVEAILPVSLSYEQRQDGITNEKIDELNKEIYAMTKRKGLYYLASDEALKDEMNCLDSKYSGDGLHFNENAYVALKEYILTHAIYKK